MQSGQSIVAKIAHHSDVALAAGVVGIILVMLIPLPPILLDILLSFNITFALIILLISLYALRPLDFSIFPSLLLVSALSRLALNVSSTRLILLHGNEGDAAAGQVIRSFGNFVVGGNYVVGFVVFLILVVIQFVVITKGSGRIAEVAARFTLDAMPGKQMSIDADLNAGVIDDNEARERRQMISREADFYGAMDGASKFVRGDAIAGIIILIIDIIGGIVIGVIYHRMSIGDAGRVYAILTIGDGLVSQVPALIISTAAGIIVSRAASDVSFGKELMLQFLVQPKAFAIASGMLFVMGLIPGLPKAPFLLLSCAAGVVAYVNRHGPIMLPEPMLDEAELAAEEPEREQEEDLNQIMEIDPMGLEISHTLIPLVDVEQNGRLLDRIKITRRQCALEMGFVVPPIRIRDNIQLRPGEYDILIRGARLARGKLMLGHYLAMNPGTAIETELISKEGIETQEPVFGLTAYWISEAQKEMAELAGYTVVDPETILATHLTEIIKSHAHELFGRQELQNILDNIEETHPNMVKELIPNVVPRGTLQRVCSNLLKEKVSIRDMIRILEVLADLGSDIKDADILTEYVRHALSRTLVKPLLIDDELLKVLTLDPSVEEIIMNGLVTMDGTAPSSSLTPTSLALDAETQHRVINAIAKAINNPMLETQPVIICSSLIRRHLRSLTENLLPLLVILSYNEVPSNIEVQQVGVITL